jgi:surface protein
MSAFIFKIDTSKGNSRQLTLAIDYNYRLNYNFNVNWGDGTSTNVTPTSGIVWVIHNYTYSNIYTVTITGSCPKFEFYDDNSQLKVISVDQWGDVGFVSTDYMFGGCSNLTSVASSDGTWCRNVTNMGGMFLDCTSLTNLNINNWDVSNVTDMSYMFRGVKLSTLNLNNWNTSNVTRMQMMFYNCSNLSNLYISNWDVSKVTTFEEMFWDCPSLTNIDFSNWDFSSAIQPDSFRLFLQNTPLNINSYTNLIIRLNETLVNSFTGNLDANLCRYICDIQPIHDNLSTKFNAINDLGCIDVGDIIITINSVTGKQYDPLNLGKWFYQVNWTNVGTVDFLKEDFKIEFKSKNTNYFKFPVDNLNSTKLSGSNLLRSDESYNIRIGYLFGKYSNVFNLKTSDINFPYNINYNNGIFKQTINWTLVDHEHYYDCKVYIQVDGVGEFLINPNSNYLNTTQFNITGLKPNTKYTWRFKIVHSNQYHSTDRTYISNDYSFTTKNLPKHLCNSNLNKIKPDCGNSNGGIYIPIESGYTVNNYLELFNLSLLVYDLNTNTESLRTDVTSSIDGIGFNNLESGYYHLTITPKPDVWYHYGREGCVNEWIKLENNNSTVGVISVRAKPAICSGFDSQPGRLQVLLDGASPYYKYWFFNNDGLLIKNGTTTNSYIVLNNATECYYGVIEDSNGCRYLIDEVCIPSETSSSISGIKQLFIAPVTGDIDFDYYNTEDDDYYLDGEDKSFFMSTKISRINTNLTWYKIPIHNGQVSFKQELTKNRQGFIFSDVMEVGIAHQTQEKLNTLLRNLLNKFIVVFQDANGNWWISGYTSHASLDTVVLTTGRRYESNQYTLKITSNSADNIITNIDEDWVKNNILN